MPIVKAGTKIADIAMDEPAIIPLLSRLGIKPGYGDMTIDDAAVTTGGDPSFMLMLINTWLVDDYFPESRLKVGHLNHIIKYLSSTNDYYLNSRLPNIDRHFSALLRNDNGGGKLALIKQLYDRLKTALVKRISYDRDIFFPAISNGVDAAPIALGIDPAEALGDLRSMLIIHISGVSDANLWYAVIVAVDALEKDMHKNERIRSLLPSSTRS